MFKFEPQQYSKTFGICGQTKLDLVWSGSRDSLNLKQCIAGEASYLDKRSSRNPFIITLRQWLAGRCTPCGLMLPEKLFIN